MRRNKKSNFPFELDLYRTKDIDGEVELKVYAVDFELYKIVCVDLKNGKELKVGTSIVGLHNVEDRFNEAVESLSGAYTFPEEHGE